MNRIILNGELDNLDFSMRDFKLNDKPPGIHYTTEETAREILHDSKELIQMELIDDDIFEITSPRLMKGFIEEFGYGGLIQWAHVYRIFNGVEININTAPFKDQVWLYEWTPLPSGYVWHKNAIQSINRISVEEIKL